MTMTTHQHRGNADAIKQDARRFPRQAVSWLVSVSVGSRQLQARTKDTSAGGAKILLNERLPLGSPVLLQFRPPGRSPVETHGLVWRLDHDGFACLFVGNQDSRFLEAVTPPRRVTQPGETERRATVLLSVIDPGVRDLAVAALGARGHTVLDAGPQPLLAMRLAQEHPGPIDLMLVDGDLRLMNGIPLVERLVLQLPAAKVLLIATGSAQKSTTIADASCLPVPCAKEELLARVQALLGAPTR